MNKVKFCDILEYEQPSKYIVESDQYKDEYKTPVLTAGKSFILGYTNETEGIYHATKEHPIILFDDFTTDCKYIDFDFKVKSSAIKILKPRQSINLKYIYYALKNIVYDTTSHKRYWISQYSNFTIKLPTMKEQDKIVNELECIEKLINNKEQQKMKFNELIKSQYIEMFGDIINNSKKLKIKNLNDVSSVSSSKRIYAREYVESGIPFYRSKEIIELSHRRKPSVELFISKERYLEIKNKFGVPQIGDIMITAVGTIGETWVVNNNNPFYFKDGNLLLVRPNTEMNNVYFKYLLDELISNFKYKNISVGAYSALTIEKLKKMQVLVPPMDLQKQFEIFIKNVNKQKKYCDDEILKLSEIIKCKMQEYFGGVINE